MLASVATEERTEPKQGVANPGARHGGRLAAKALKARGVTHLFTLSRRAPLQPLRRLQGGGHRGHRRAPRAGGGLRRRGLGEGDPHARRLRADRRAGRHQRDERARQRPLERHPDRRPRRPRPGDALGLGKPAGDRPPAVRLAADEVGGDGRGGGADRRGHGPRVRPRRRRADRPDLPRLPARRRLHGGRRRHPRRPGRRRRRRSPPTSSAPPSCSPAPSARRSWPAPASTGRRGEEALRELAERARDPRLPERHGPRLPPGRPRARLQPHPRHRAQGRRRRRDRRRPARLPARLRRRDRRGREADPRRRRAQPARAQPGGRRRPGRRRRGDPDGARRGGGSAGASPDRTRAGSTACAPRRPRSARRRPRTAPTPAARCTRCASTPSSRRSSTATRS